MRINNVHLIRVRQDWCRYSTMIYCIGCVMCVSLSQISLQINGMRAASRFDPL